MTGVGVGVPNGWRPRGAIWTPASITGIVDYGIGSGIVESGGKATSWPGVLAAATVAQSTGSLQPVYDATGSPNGNPVLSHDGVDDRFGTDDAAGVMPSTLTQPYTEFGLTKYDIDAGNQSLAGGSDAANQFSLTRIGGAKWQWEAGTERQPARSQSAGNWYRWIVVVNGASSTFEIDEVSIDTGNIGAEALSHLRLGQNAGLSQPLGGDIAVWGLVDAAMGAADKTSLWAWLGDQ